MNCTLTLLSISPRPSFHLQRSAEGFERKFQWRGARDFMQNIFQKLGNTCSLIQEGESIGGRVGGCVIV